VIRVGDLDSNPLLLGKPFVRGSLPDVISHRIVEKPKAGCGKPAYRRDFNQQYTS
jgi:hypothetical protein